RVIIDGAAFALRGRGVMRRGRALVHRQLIPDFGRFFHGQLGLRRRLIRRWRMHFWRGVVGPVVFRPHARTEARPVRRGVVVLAVAIVGDGIVELVRVRRLRRSRLVVVFGVDVGSLDRGRRRRRKRRGGRLDRGERRRSRRGGGRRRRRLAANGRRRAHA